MKSFDELLAMTPDELDAYKEQEVERLIEASDPEHRRKLYGLQFKIDSHRHMAKNPIDSCVRISKLMHESFAELAEELKRFSP